MKKIGFKSLTRAVLPLAVLAGVSVEASSIKITVENLSPDDGIWFTPVFLGFHDGSFDTFDAGSAASGSIEALAEGGDTSGLMGDIGSVSGAIGHTLVQDTTAMGPPGVLFNPGSSNSYTFDLDSTDNRYFSFASMLLPSNDAFFGNDDAMGYELFDINGDFNYGFEVNIYGSDIWDSGTEENDGMGAPFSMIGGVSTDTVNGVVAQHAGLDNFIGTNLGNGNPLGSAFSANTALVRITAEKVPDATPFIGAIGGLALLGFNVVARRKRFAEEAKA
ncbi:spondin domain-containing protein [Puniceicoccaceae bacterium K14]|nr:spondin domain-containing protein [Puniceicoccaceae bacterium K14]